MPIATYKAIRLIIYKRNFILFKFSTMSAGLNTLAGTFYEDFVTLCLPKNVSDATASIVMKIVVVIFGCVCITMVYLVEKLGPIMQVKIY